ncbi:MAG: phosphatase PAP2 family protein [Verrucomicrobiaceae bacterium]
MRARLQAQWRFKLLLTVLLNLIFWMGYGWLGRHAYFPLHRLPFTWIDQAVPFQQQPWAWIYLSQFLFTSIMPWLLVKKEGVYRYAMGVAVMSAASFLIFLIFPVAAPRAVDLPADGSMAWIVLYDGPLNAFPSLHAGFLVYTGLLAWRMFGHVTPLVVAAGVLIWGGLILYSTIATRQHYALDLVAGATVGYLADWFAWRMSPRLKRTDLCR